MIHSPSIAATILALCLLVGCSDAPKPAPKAASGTAGTTVDRVRALAAEQFDVGAAQITRKTTLGDLGADELDLVELVMTLEDEFDVTIPDEAVGGSAMNGMTMERLAGIVEAQKPK